MRTNPKLRELLHHFVFENSHNTIPRNPQRVSKIKEEEIGARANIYLLVYGSQGKHCCMMNSNPMKLYRHFRANTIASIRRLSAQVVVASICEDRENNLLP
jgi:hypothetical protein